MHVYVHTSTYWISQTIVAISILESDVLPTLKLFPFIVIKIFPDIGIFTGVNDWMLISCTINIRRYNQLSSIRFKMLQLCTSQMVSTTKLDQNFLRVEYVRNMLVTYCKKWQIFFLKSFHFTTSRHTF